tara:strand:- start:673 stop:1014 length:342 start_codon:yes stop_codon:yes gene_type:complete
MNLMDYYNQNRDRWMFELLENWKKDIWTDVCLQEYCAFKVWVYSQGKEYFKQMQLYMEQFDKNTNLDDLQKDAWNIYLSDMGISRKGFMEEFQEILDQGDFSKIKNNNERGIA